MNKKGGLTKIVGEDLNRFVLHSTLLRLIDPIRGEPTRSVIDEDPNIEILGTLQLKQKFLDSFALICSTLSSGAITATAVCLETYEQTGNILRVARNHGLKPNDLKSLKKVLQTLQEVARKEKSSKQAEPEILQVIVELDRDRILSIAERVRKRGIQDFLRLAQSRLYDGRVKSESFRLWLEDCPFTTSPPQNWSHATITIFIHWASQARWLHAEQLQILLGLDKSQDQAWVESLYKVARYHSAIKSMVKLAVREPMIFANISIQDIKAPYPCRFKFPRGETPLLAMVSKLVGKDTRSTMEQLEKHLDTQNLEVRLRQACPSDLTLHAEMQMVVFYEGNPECVPLMRLIGTSKKACFLCDKYLRHHPLRLQVSACHQKIYPSWMPPPYYKVSGQFKSTPFIRLANDIEKLTRRELKTALNAPRRPRTYDSTAGPTLTLTATIPTELRSMQPAQDKLAVQNDGFSDDSD